MHESIITFKTNQIHNINVLGSVPGSEETHPHSLTSKSGNAK